MRLWGRRMKKDTVPEYAVRRIGTVKKTDDEVRVCVYPEFAEGLEGLDQFSHIIVFYWFHQNDTEEKRKTLKVHPRGNRSNPLTGVFATRSPARPNLIGMTICRLVSMEGAALHVDGIDAFDGTPVIDIKPCIGRLDLVSQLRVPAWAERAEDEDKPP